MICHTVKYFGNEQYETDLYTESIRQFNYLSTATQMSLLVLNTSQSFIIQSTLCASLMFVAYNVVEAKSMNVGDFVSVSVYISQLFAPLAWLGSIYDAVVQSFVDMQNLRCVYVYLYTYYEYV